MIVAALISALSVFANPLIKADEQTPHPFSIHDMLAMERLSDLQVSADGKTLVFVVRSTDLEANRGRTDLWVMDADGGSPRRLTKHEASDFNPRFSSDGSQVFFLSTRSGSVQVWSLSPSGGELQQVTHLPLDVEALQVAPNGRHLGIALEVFPSKSIEETVHMLEEREKNPRTGQLYDRLFIRHWDQWKDGRRLHLFSFDLQTKQAVDVMKEMDADCPTKPFGGPEDFTFTPDSSGLVFCARDVGREEAWSTDFDLYLSSVDGSKPPECLTESNQAWDASPSFSPDGKTLAYAAMARPGFESDQFTIHLRDWATGETRTLAEPWDRSAGSVVWSPDSQSVYVAVNDKGQHPLYQIGLEDETPKKLVSEGTVRGFVVTEDKIIYGLDHLKSPVEFYACDHKGGQGTRITHFNDAKLSMAKMGEPEPFTFAGWNNETVHAYTLTPVDFDPDKKFPVAFLIHGGPQGSFGNDFHYRWNPQAYAGAGYAVVMVDFHGSVGYGQDFVDSIRNDWGGKPLLDLQKGLAAALKKYPWMDGERVCALGASYGGYMINWISGKWSDRFRCLVNHDGNLDERMAYFNTEELWFPEWEREGTPFDNPDAYQKHTPLDFVDQWKTPMLVIHGALDYRVVDTQGIATFTALQRRGIPSQFLYFQDENHWVLKPHNSIQWHETVLAWIDRWTKGE